MKFLRWCGIARRFFTCRGWRGVWFERLPAAFMDELWRFWRRPHLATLEPRRSRLELFPFESRDILGDPIGYMTAPILGIGGTLLGTAARLSSFGTTTDPGVRSSPAVTGSTIPSVAKERMPDAPLSSASQSPRATFDSPRPTVQGDLFASVFDEDWYSDGDGPQGKSGRHGGGGGGPSPKPADGGEGNNGGGGSGGGWPGWNSSFQAPSASNDPALSLLFGSLNAANSGTNASNSAVTAAPAMSTGPETLPTSTYVPSPSPSFPSIPGTLAPSALQRFAPGPIRFEPNVGQGQPGTDFTSSDLGYQLGITPSQAILTLAAPAGNPQGPPVEVGIQFLGANPNATIAGSQLLPGTSNYYLGQGPNQVATDVPGYSQVEVDNLYPGINLVYYSTASRGLEFDFQVAPGADPRVIHLSYSGTSSVTRNSQGDIVLHTAVGNVTQNAPQLYQVVNGAQQPITGQYTEFADGQFGVQPGSYDPSLPLIVDPTLGYSGSPSLGGYIPQAVAVDGSGNLYMTGAYTPYEGANTEVFVRKLSADGSTVDYTTLISGNGNQTTPALALGGSNVYVAGTTSSSNLSVLNAYQSSLTGDTNAFLATLNASTGIGSELTYLGGSDTDTGNAVAVNNSGDIFIAGATNSSDFPAAATVLGSRGSGSDAYLTEFNDAASSLLATAFIGGMGSETTTAMTLDTAGNAYLSGTTNAANLPVTSGAFQQNDGGGSNTGFVAKVLANDSAFGYITYLGGRGTDVPTALAVDGEGSAYVVGSTTSPDFPTANPLQAGGPGGAFITKLNPSGSAEVYSTTLGTLGATATGVAVDAEGRAVLTGLTGGVYTAYPTLNPLDSPDGTQDGAFLSMLTPQGTGFVYSTLLGGTNVDQPAAVAVDPAGDAYVAGADSTSTTGEAAEVSPILDATASPMLLGITPATGSSSISLYTNSSSTTLYGLAAPDTIVQVTATNGAVVGTATADATGTWSLALSGLPAGISAFTVSKNLPYSVNNVPSAPLLVTVDDTAPTVTISAPASTTARQPVVQVAASDLYGLPDGTAVYLVEVAGSTTTTLDGALRGGVASFTLPDIAPGNSVTVAASVYDRAGNLGQSSTQTISVNAVSSAWQMTASALTWDVNTGEPLYQTGDVQYSIPLDLDQSPGSSVSLDPDLVYNADAVSVRPVIQASLVADNSVASLTPTLDATLTWDGVAQTMESFATAGLTPGQALTLSVRPDNPVTAAGRHSWSLQVVVNYHGAGTNVTETASGITYTVPEDNSPFGPGWTFSSTDQLIAVAASGSNPAGELRAYGTGGWAFYQSLGSGNYQSPVGDPGTLTQLANNTFKYVSPDGTTETFDANGHETAVISPDGTETVAFTYSGGALTGMTTPDGAVTTFSYSSGLISGIATGYTDYTLGHDTTSALVSLGCQLTTSFPCSLYSFTYDSAEHLTGANSDGVLNSWGYTDGVVSSETLGSNEGDTSRITPVAAVGLATLGGPAAATVQDPFSYATVYTLDSQGRLLREQDPDGTVTSWGRDANGRSTTVTDPMGLVTTTAYDSLGYVTQVTYPDGSTEQYQYQTAFHALTQYTDALGHTTEYGYDSEGHQTSVTNALSQTTDSTYYASGSANGLLETVTDPLGHTTTYSYDGDRRLTRTTDPLGNSAYVSYDEYGNVSTTTDADGHVTSYVYDQLDRLIQETDALGNTTTYTYFANTDSVLSKTDARGLVTAYSYDDRGLQLSVAQGGAIYPDTTEVQLSSVTYDRAGRALWSMDGDGHPTQTSYDAVSQPVVVTNALGGQTVTSYDADGDVTATRDALGRWTTLGLDIRGWVTTSTDPLGLTTTTAYDAAGDVTSVTNPLGNVTATAYDALNRKTAVTQAAGTPLAQTTTTAYDAAGNVTATTDVGGVTTTYAYDADNDLIGKTEAAGTLLQLGYSYSNDPNGNVTSQTAPNGAITTMAYDADNRSTSVTEGTNTASPRTSTSGYDAVGNMTTATDADGNTTTYAYDGLNRQVVIYYPDHNVSGHVTSNTYDAAGDLVSVGTTFDDGTVAWTTYSYDALNRPTASTMDGTSNSGSMNPRIATTTTIYDAVGDPVLLFGPNPGMGTENDYDADHRRIRLIQFASDGSTPTPITTFAYDNGGDVTQTVNPLGYINTYVLDTLGRTTEDEGPLDENTFTYYDVYSRVTETVDPMGHVTDTGYDVLGRITSVTQAVGTPLASTTTTGYDLMGDVTSVTTPAGTTTYAYDALDRMTSSTDALGNHTTYATDALGHPTLVTDPLGNETAYTYDGAYRVASVVNGAQLTTSFQVVTTYTYGAQGKPQKVAQGGGMFNYYTYDGLGDIVTSNSSSGSISYSYDAAGNLIMTQDSNFSSSLDNLGNISTYVYDLLGRRTLAIDALGNRTTFAYDLAGDDTMQVDRNGHARTFTYDALGRVTRDSGFDATITSTRDLDGNVLTMTEVTSSLTSILTFTYDALNRLSTATDVYGNIQTYTYAANGQVSTITDSLGGLVSYSFDADGNTTGQLVTQSGGLAATFTYGYNNANQATLATDVGVGMQAGYAYNGAGLLATQTYGTTSRYIEVLTYTYNGTGLVSGETRSAYVTPSDAAASTAALSYAYNPRFTFTTTFGYSGTQQMTYGYGVVYNYDPSGNLLTNGAAIGPANLVAQDNTNSYTYDAEGNLVKKVNKATNETTTYTYDQYNRLLTATDSTYSTFTHDPYTEQWATTYTYDALGRLVASQSWTTTITASSNRYLYNGSTLVADLDSSDNVVTRYAYAPNGDLAARLEKSNNRVLWYIDDNTGTVIDVVDSQGDARLRLKNGGYNIADSWQATSSDSGYVYDSNGQWDPIEVSWTYDGTPVTNRFQLAGKWLDTVSNLYYLGGVFYDPLTNRTLSEQVGGLTGGNLYTYQQDNPVNWGPMQGDGSIAEGKDVVSSAAAGLQDTLMGGDLQGRQARQLLGGDLLVDYNSKSYRGTRYVQQDASNWANRAWGEFNYQPIQAWGNISYGFADVMTAGLTKYTRKPGLVDETSAMYAGGAYLGKATNLAVTAVAMALPGIGELAAAADLALVADMAEVASWGIEGLNSIQTLGMAMSGADAFRRGDLQGTVDALVGMGGVLLRGISPCGWASGVVEWGHRGILAYNMIQDGKRAYEALAEGNPLDALLNAASASLNFEGLMQSCFTWRMPLLTPQGNKLISQLQEGDELLTRLESDVNAVVVASRVMRVLTRTGRVWEFEVHGEVIESSGEHLIFVRERGWVEVAELRVGDWVNGADGTWNPVEAVRDTGRYEALYNVTVEGYHTYFVGSHAWKFSIWAHNYGRESRIEDWLASNVPEEHQAGVRAALNEFGRLAPPPEQKQIAVAEGNNELFASGETVQVDGFANPRPLLYQVLDLANAMLFELPARMLDHVFPGSWIAGHAEKFASLFSNIMATYPRASCSNCGPWMAALSEYRGIPHYVADAPNRVQVYQNGAHAGTYIFPG